MKIKKVFDVAIVTGVLLGTGSVLLSYLGNPVNSGICLSCFLENLAGAMQLHHEVRMSYIRPELLGFVLGSFLVAVKTRRYSVTGGSSPAVRFSLGLFIILGCAVFIGCPIKMILRLAAGDLTAVAAAMGLVVGVWAGTRYIRSGVSLDRPARMPAINGYIFPAFCLLLLFFFFMRPVFIIFGQTGPASLHAPVFVALFIGLVIGGFAQRSGLCITGGLRNFFLVREKTLLMGVIATFLGAMLMNFATKQFHLGLNGQPASHLSHGWSFLAMVLVGLASVIIDGCPFRQIIKAGQGDVDAAITCFGMLFGAALAVDWSMRATSAGPTFAGKIAVLSGLIICVVVTLSNRRLQEAGNRR